MGTAGLVWEGASNMCFIRPCCRHYLWLLSKKQPQSSTTLRHSRPRTKQPSQLAAPWLHSSDRGLRSPRAHVGCSGGWLAQPGDCPSAGTPPLSARCCRDHLPGACLQNEDGAPGHPSPSRVWLKCQPQRTGHRRACPGTRAKCWCGLRAGARLVKCLLGMV